MNKPLFAKSLLALAVAFGSIGSGHAASQQFYADQLTAITPAEERDNFLKASSGVQSEGFESAPTGIPAGALSVFNGQGSLTQDPLADGSILQGSPQNGRFNTTPGCDIATACKWWETAYSFEITLGSLKSAFGFFATDVGDLGGAITLDFWNDANKVRAGIAVTEPSEKAGLLFFGWVDDSFSFNRVTVNVIQTRADPDEYDGIGFDDILIGTRAVIVDPPPPSNPVSAPASLALVGLSLALLAASRRRAQAPAGS